MPSPRQIQRALNKGLPPPFYIGCSLVLKCRDKPYTFFWAPSGPGPPRHLGCAARNGSPRARRTPAACPGFGPVLVASWPPGRGLQQPPQAGPVGPAARTSARSQCSRTDRTPQTWCPRPPPPAVSRRVGSKRGPSRGPATPSADPFMPSECCAHSRSLPQTRIHRAELCHLPLMGDPTEGLKLPPQPGRGGPSKQGRASWLGWRPTCLACPTRSCSCRLWASLLCRSKSRETAARLCCVPISFSDSAVFSDSFRDRAWAEAGSKGLGGSAGHGGTLGPFPHPALGNVPSLSSVPCLGHHRWTRGSGASVAPEKGTTTRTASLDVDTT